MTLKYESEILFDLMKRDGDDTPSDVLPYESELKEKYLKQVEGAYPKLMDYRPEWLNYNLEAHLPADFPVETLSNVTSATVDNVVPYAYRSAILKGQTLINIKTKYNTSPSTGSWFVSVYDINTLKINTKYLIKVFNKTNIDVTFYPSSTNVTGTDFEAKANSIGVGIITTNSTISNDIMLRLRNSSEDVVGFNCNILLLEYQDGMENWDIPYFEGMQSVKMPVLTTTGKNLFDGEMVQGYIGDSSGNLNPDNTTGISSANFTPVKPNTTYRISLSDNPTNGTIKIYYYDNDKKYTGTNKTTTTFTTDNDVAYVKFRIHDSAGVSLSDYKNVQFQIEEGLTQTTYEPYQSNILTVNEDVTLRSNGDICDELNLLTGQLTQRIGEDGVVLSQEVVKTVDLNIQDQDGNTLRKIRPIEGTMHIHSDGTPVKPAITMEIPVEAITQNLASFIKEE